MCIYAHTVIACKGARVQACWGAGDLGYDLSQKGCLLLVGADFRQLCDDCICLVFCIVFVFFPLLAFQHFWRIEFRRGLLHQPEMID